MILVYTSSMELFPACYELGNIDTSPKRMEIEDERGAWWHVLALQMQEPIMVVRVGH